MRRAVRAAMLPGMFLLPASPPAIHRFSGTLIGPDDDGYDAARRVHNHMIDRRPALIARCESVSDVAAALAYARREGLEVAVRAGSHSAARSANCCKMLTVRARLLGSQPRPRRFATAYGKAWTRPTSIASANCLNCWSTASSSPMVMSRSAT